jgi:hypothetical protein
MYVLSTTLDLPAIFVGQFASSEIKSNKKKVMLLFISEGLK